MLRKYAVVAIQILITYNNFGDHDPDGLMYVLAEKEDNVKQQVKEKNLLTADLVQPLVLRANKGDTVEIHFTNKLKFNASVNLKGLDYQAITSDGAFIGENPDTTAAPGETIIYRFEALAQGAFQFSDLGNPLSSELGSNLHGLFGVFVVEAPGSTWTDPETGEAIDSGTMVDVHNPFLPSFREYVMVFHDEVEIKDKHGQAPQNPMHPIEGQHESTMPINYRAEPMRNRLKLIMEGKVCHGCVGEEVHHDSWPFGDPSTPVTRAYVGDPIRFHIVHGGVKETHIFHLHTHQWLFEANDPEAQLNDSRGLSPQQTVTFNILYGAGSLQGSYGDSVWHCHLYPHFHEGMWGILRVHNVLEEGVYRFYPDGTPIPRLMPLPDREPLPKPTPKRPGFPLFIPGVVGERAPYPPLGGGRSFPPTELEKNAFDPNPVPGAPFVNPCPEGAPVRRYYIVAIQMPIVYNKAGWVDPQGRLYVLAEDEQDVLSGKKKPEPLFIRANSGECIEIHFTNKLPETIGGTPFQHLEKTPLCGVHVHFVKFDVLASDGGNIGWNYLNGIAPGHSRIYRWFADTELKTVFFHDHMFASSHQHHGVFGALLVEPAGSRFIDSHTAAPVTGGTEATIENPFIPDFREWCLAIHDFVPAFNKEGKALNPPAFPGSFDDFGVMAINYRNEPFQIRGGEPAYVLSSWVHGDPATPVFQGYQGDPVRIRLIQGAFEESHAINIHRQTWLFERGDLDSPLTQAQHIGISEAFIFEFALESNSRDDDFDLLYYSAGLDDFWLGCWGLIRARGREVPFLKPLADREPLPKRVLPLPVPNQLPPHKAMSPGEPCPKGVPVRKYHLAAIQHPIVYNKYGDHDPFGMIFVPINHVDDIYKGKKKPEPIVIRANVGDCIEVTLTNLMPKWIPDHHHPKVPVEAPWPYSPRVSIHAQLVGYDVLGSDGTTVGFNPDQTIGPGESITYRWYASSLVGTSILADFGDVRNHRHHGLFGALVIEPEGSSYRNTFTGKDTPFGLQSDILNFFVPNTRELVVMLQDGVYMVDKNGELLPKFFQYGDEANPGEELDDPEDQGMRAINYRCEPFFNRLKENSDVSKVFSTAVHGYPATTPFQVYVGDPTTIRLMMAADKPRAHSFFLHGHIYRQQGKDVSSEITGVQGEVTIGRKFDKKLLHTAGGFLKVPGDYLYRAGMIRWDIELGMWGILKVSELNIKLPGPNKKITPTQK